MAWIVGAGSSSGLGAALVRRFARGGLLVVVTGRSRGRVTRLAEEIKDGGGDARALHGDISDATEARRLGAEVATYGELKVAIFNAGNMVRGTPLDLTPAQFEATWRGSAFAGFLFAQQALELLMAAGGGSLLFTGATASLRGRGQTTAFASAKAALRSLVQSVAREYGPIGVHAAHVVIDGGIDGDQLRDNAPAMAQHAGVDGLLHPDAIAETYWQLHLQPRSAWTHELDLRPFKETF